MNKGHVGLPQMLQNYKNKQEIPPFCGEISFFCVIRYFSCLSQSSHHNLLRFHILAIDEAEDVNARCHPICRDVACNVCITNDPPYHVNHL